MERTNPFPTVLEYVLMALCTSASSLGTNPCTSLYYLSSSSSSSSFLFLPTIRSSSYRKCSCSCSYQTIEYENHKPHDPKSCISTSPKRKKTKQKLKPSFYDQVRDKWSLKTNSQRIKFPWQEQQGQEQEEFEEAVEEEGNKQQYDEISEEDGTNSLLDNPTTMSFGNHLTAPPWVSRSKFDSLLEVSHNCEEVELGVDNISGDYEKKRVDLSTFKRHHFDSKCDTARKISGLHSEEELMEVSSGDCDSKTRIVQNGFKLDGEETRKYSTSLKNEAINQNDDFKESEALLKLKKEKEPDEELDDFRLGQTSVGISGSSQKTNSIELPWESKSNLESSIRGEWRRSKAEVAEQTIPETELKRLRNVSLRMKERLKVRAAGVTQGLVDKIHEKWKEEEVVKLKFEGPPAFNMKRTHQTLERRTGGLVIWRSGSSLVLYRGMSYRLPCVQQYAKLNEEIRNDKTPLKASATNVIENVGVNDAAESQELADPRTAKLDKGSAEEMMDLGDLNNLLDELGPRFIDWSGPEPLPVDADRLPSVVPGYTSPFRVLPYKVRPVLGNRGTTLYRRLARTSPPHFALGRNRELQGLARAMVKLWERNAIAKIAIKRGVLNTNNERMAEELKRLTGGTLLSRNKEYIVFYRGNDFMTPPVTEALLERQKTMEVHQEEEEIARERASTLLVPKAKAFKGPLVAGTLAETLAAKSRWGNEPSSEDLQKMRRDFTLAKHASVVRYLEKKLARAQDKVNKAEKALRKVQEFLKPTELPSDLEIITDEERVLFRKMGLSMKAFLLVGRREVFDGTVENMHMHWNYRELVKIIVRGKNFPQVKHMAISLEAESGGLLISVDKTTKGYAIVMYRGKNYQRPQAIRPNNLLTKRQALARSIELQRREALLHHISDLREKIKIFKSGLDEVEAAKEAGEEIPTRIDDTYYSDDDFEVEGEEAYLKTYDNGDDVEDGSDEEFI